MKDASGVFIVAALLVLSPAMANAQTAHVIATNPPPVTSALKGFVPYPGQEGSWPCSLENQVIGLSSTQIGYTSFDWTPLESMLNDNASRGCQTCVNFYLDWPGDDTLDCPFFLQADGVTFYAYPGCGASRSPDYTNPKLLTALTNFIAALGAKYNNDPRVAYVNAGLLGSWGEWNLSGGQTNQGWSLSWERAICQTYTNAFPNTQVNLRYPDVNLVQYGLGYRDDSFSEDTYLPGMNWGFYQKLQATGDTDFWKTRSMGGELYPQLQGTIFNTSPFTGGDGATWAQDLGYTHVTFLMNNSMSGYTGTTLSNAMLACSQMGYDFQVVNAYYYDNLTPGLPFYLGIDMKNIGIAPFYYPWNVQIGIKQNGALVVIVTNTGWDIRTVPADGGAIHSFGYTAPNPDLPSGTYTMNLRIANPLPYGYPVYFANAGQNTSNAVPWSFTVGATLNQTFPADTGGGDPFFGQIDEVAVWNSALSGAQISSLYSSGVAYNPLLWLGFNNSLADGGTSTNSHVVTLHNVNGNGGFTNSVANGTCGAASEYFPGDGSFVEVANVSGLNFNTSKPFTISAWVKPGDTNGGMIAAKSSPITVAGNSGTHTLAFYLEPGGYLRADVFYVGTVISSKTVPANQWTHVALTYTGSRYQLYINGVADNSGSFGGANEGANLFPDGWLDLGSFTVTAATNVWLNCALTNNQIYLNWEGSGWKLQQTPALGAAANWSDVPGGSAPTNLPIGSSSLFFRLISQ